MSDNQKPTRDTGEEVCEKCEMCGDPAWTDVHNISAYPDSAHPYKPAPKAPAYKPAQLSGDSGQSKPAPKAPAQALNEYMKHLEANGERVDEAPKAPVREPDKLRDRATYE